MTVPQLFTRTFGAVYVLVGIAGFVPFLGGTFTQTPNQLLGIFGVTLTHNIVHLAIGAVFLAASSADRTARGISVAVGATYLLVAAIGFAGVAFTDQLLALNLADNLLHLATGVLSLIVGLFPFARQAPGVRASYPAATARPVSPEERDRILGIR